jgi:hypothetical protein
LKEATIYNHSTAPASRKQIRSLLVPCQDLMKASKSGLITSACVMIVLLRSWASKSAGRIVGIGIHFVAVPALIRTAVTTTVMCDHPIVSFREIEHLRIPRIGIERPAVRKVLAVLRPNLYKRSSFRLLS